MDGFRSTCAMLAVLLVWLGAPAADAVEPSDEAADQFATFDAALLYADNAWVFGDYGLVVTVLEPWLFPTPPPASESVLIRAYERLGASAWYERGTARADGYGTTAEDAFVALLRLDSEHELDPFVHPAPLVQYFENVRTAHADELGPATTPLQPGSTIYVERRVRSQSIMVSMLPFGWGFYAADRDGLATAYLITEVALGATSAGLYWANEVTRGADGLYDDVSLPERRRRIQVVAGWGFFAAIAANMVHGALAHRSITSVEYRTLTEPPRELVEPGARIQAPRRFRFSFSPTF